MYNLNWVMCVNRYENLLHIAKYIKITTETEYMALNNATKR